MKWAPRQSPCHRKDGARKRIVDSPAQAIRAIEWAAQVGKRVEPYRCPACGYVHIGSQPGWNRAPLVAERLAARASAEPCTLKPTENYLLPVDRSVGDP